MRKVVKAIIYKKNKYLLQLRDNKDTIFYPNQWCFFGGESEVDENTESTLKREVREELTWEPNHFSFFTKRSDLHTNCLIFYYLVYFNTSFKKLTLNEGQEMRWFSIDQIQKLVTTPINMHKFLKAHKLQKMILSNKLESN